MNKKNILSSLIVLIGIPVSVFFILKGIESIQVWGIIRGIILLTIAAIIIFFVVKNFRTFIPIAKKWDWCNILLISLEILLFGLAIYMFVNSGWFETGEGYVIDVELDLSQSLLICGFLCSIARNIRKLRK